MTNMQDVAIGTFDLEHCEDVSVRVTNPPYGYVTISIGWINIELNIWQAKELRDGLNGIELCGNQEEEEL